MSERTKRLLVRFAPLDLEAKTRPMPVIACPRLFGEARPLALCGRCARAEQVEIASSAEITLTCRDDFARQAEWTGCSPRWVWEFAHLPPLCAARDTPAHALAALVGADYLRPIPVLDREGRLAGIVMIAAILDALAQTGAAEDGPTAGALMAAAPPSVRFDAALVDALRLLSQGAIEHLAVTSARGRFLGLLARTDLPPSAAS